MRPGQTAPECCSARSWAGNSGFCFNEAGADCPGMLRALPGQFLPFSAASMRPGQTAPECCNLPTDTDKETDMLQ